MHGGKFPVVRFNLKEKYKPNGDILIKIKILMDK